MEVIKNRNDPLETAQRLIRKAQRISKTVLANTEGTDVALTNGKEIAQFISALSQLTRAASDLERVKAERDGAITLAGREIVRELRELLRGKPELLAQILEVVEEAEKRKLQEQARQLDGKGAKSMGKATMIMANQTGDYMGSVDPNRREELRRGQVDYYANHSDAMETD